MPTLVHVRTQQVYTLDLFRLLYLMPTTKEDWNLCPDALA